MIKMLVIVMLLVGCKGNDQKAPPPRDPDGPPASVEQKLEKIQADLADVDKKVEAATAAVGAAKDDAEREGAKARLEKLQQDQLELKKRVELAKALVAKCKENPLNKGCESQRPTHE
jgi:DNA repair exonuclease SbcCD ATPase subunit